MLASLLKYHCKNNINLGYKVTCNNSTKNIELMLALLLYYFLFKAVPAAHTGHFMESPAVDNRKGRPFNPQC